LNIFLFIFVEPAFCFPTFQFQLNLPLTVEAWDRVWAGCCHCDCVDDRYLKSCHLDSR